MQMKILHPNTRSKICFATSIIAYSALYEIEQVYSGNK